MMNHFIQFDWVIHGWILSYSDRKEFHRFSGGGFIHYSSENLDRARKLNVIGISVKEAAQGFLLE